MEISNFVKNLHSLVLPSTLWAVHIDPKEEFLAILHVNINRDRVTVDKGILITCENCALKTTISLNDEIVQLPAANSKIETVSDLAPLIYTLHEAKLCENIGANAKCTKYVLNSSGSLCDSCAFEIYSESQDYGLVQLAPASENINFDLEVDHQDVLKHEEKHKCLCTTCGKTFSYSSVLEHHMLTHAPPDDKPFKCKVCMKAFTKKYNLNVHARVHSGERPYICSKCGKTYSTRSNLSTHMNSAHCDDKRHHCELCEMSFVHPRMLRIHMRKHTGEKPFMCQVCGKVFSKNIHLTIHTRTHTGEKPYVCSACGKGFTTTGNLNSHKKINHKS